MKKNRIIIIMMLCFLSIISYGIEGTGISNDEDDIFIDIVPSEYINRKDENLYLLGNNNVIDYDKYAIVANNIDELNEKYIISDKNFSFDVEDTLEPLNRRIYSFNTQVDQKVLFPASMVYKKIVPKPIKKGISNFYGNFKEIPTFINSVLQLKLGKATNALGRFVVNSTIGIGGLNDVATKMGMKRDYETMGDTLGVYGVDAGSYVVLPILGPSSIRDGIGSAIDSTIEGFGRKEIFEKNILYDNGVNERAYGLARTTITGLDARSLIYFKYGDFNSPFEYDLVKIFYSNFRKLNIKK